MQPKSTPQRSLQDYAKQLQESLGPMVAERWRVEEIRPAHTSSGYDSVDYPDELITVSKWFDDANTALAFMESHEPTPGNKLRMRYQRGYDKVQRLWI